MSQRDRDMVVILRQINLEVRSAVLTEREALIECIRTSSWSGTEEIVAMIRRRSYPGDRAALARPTEDKP